MVSTPSIATVRWGLQNPANKEKRDTLYRSIEKGVHGGNGSLFDRLPPGALIFAVTTARRKYHNQPNVAAIGTTAQAGW